MNKSIAVLIPCYNEALTITEVINGFKQHLPDAIIYVYDNNSTDNSVEIARQAGAIVKHETRQGKGHVVNRMFADIEADIYLMVDGDATYDFESAQKMIAALLAGPYDMVNAKRVGQHSAAYRPGHTLGNRLFSILVEKIFGKCLTDLLSGYRVFSKRFVKSFPCFAKGFEIETELTVHALSLHMPVMEIATPYYPRPPGSFSKLSTFKDGFRILRVMFSLIRSEKPLLFFTCVGILLLFFALLIGLPVVAEFFVTGLVARFPSAILAASLTILSFLSITCGFILDLVTATRAELKRLFYLSLPGP